MLPAAAAAAAAAEAAATVLPKMCGRSAGVGGAQVTSVRITLARRQVRMEGGSSAVGGGSTAGKAYNLRQNG